ncbi:TPA: flagellar hook-basal body protein, partial [Candidatus Poribacteria bacterium]|nr:flagellar hook-basal body protein [Candidatus Poribacteria bacterium]
IANNLANANSIGYKKGRVGFNLALPTNYVPPQRIILASKSLQNAGEMPLMMLTRYNVDLSEGSFKQTGNPLDFAINGKGYFSIQTPNGVRYTRDGRFSIDANGFLVTRNGHRVLGQNGPINVGGGSQIQVSKGGTIRVDGRVVDRFLIVDFPPTRGGGGLSKEGNGLLIAPANLQPLPPNVEVLQGYLEESNVDIVKEMVQMIEALRNYESYQKAIQAIDSTVQQLNEFAKA